MSGREVGYVKQGTIWKQKRKVVQEAIAFVDTGCEDYKTVLMLMAGLMPLLCLYHANIERALCCRLLWGEDLVFCHISAFLMMGGGMDG